MSKDRITVDEYKKRRTRAKIAKWISPVVFWVLIGLAVLFFVLCLTNSLGNIAEISEALDNTNKTGEELQASYDAMVQKYGTWVIGSTSKGFQIEFINIKKAIVNGFSMSFFALSIIALLNAYILGKWLLPYLATELIQNNQDYVNMEVLKNLENK